MSLSTSNLPGRVELATRLLRVAFRSLRHDPLRWPRWTLKAGRALQHEGIKGVKDLVRKRTDKDRLAYERWVGLYDTLSDADRIAINTRIDLLGYKPLISVVMPIYNVEEIWLRKAIESVQHQLYPHWELCIADDASPKPHVRRVLEEYARQDSRIHVSFREENGHISAATNSALELASGEFIALLDHDDELTEHALYMVVEELNAYPEADLIYSDEDGISEKGERFGPFFKPDWAPDLFYSYNCISHLGVYRTSIVRQIGGFRAGYEGSQDYDLALRVTEQIPENHIRHIPHVLYHWRDIAGSVRRSSSAKDYAHEAARKAIRSHLERRGITATVTTGYRNFHRLIYPIPSPAPLVSLVIPTRDGLELLRQTVAGILHQTDYESVEVIIVDNQSVEPETLEYFEEIGNDPRVKVVRYDAPFNYSAINNLGMAHTRGEIVGLINNDIRISDRGWLREMVSHALRPEIGIVGAKLYYDDGRIQHAGVVIGLGGIAAHAFRLQPGESEGYMFRAKLIGNYSAVTAACAVMRREVFDEVGGLNEVDLTVAFNDVDLCLKIRERGYRILWTPYAELYHLESATRGPDTTPEKLERFEREVLYMRSQWGLVLNDDPCYNPNLTRLSDNFSLAFPPRSRKPWIIETTVEQVESHSDAQSS